MAIGVEVDLGPVNVLAELGPIDAPLALRDMGIFMNSEYVLAFRALGWRGGTKWPVRQVPNIPGIIADLQEGPTIKARRLTSAETLVDTGRLRASAGTPRIDEERETITVGVLDPKAEQHHFGLKVTVPGAGKGSTVRDPVRKNLWQLLQAQPNLRDRLGFLFGVDSFEVQLPRRPLFELTPEIRRDLSEIALEHLRFSSG